MCYQLLITHTKMLCGCTIDALPMKVYTECKCEKHQSTGSLGSTTKKVPCDDCIASAKWVKNAENKWVPA